MHRIVVLLGMIASALIQPLAAKPDYTRRTSKECLYCHPPESRGLNEAGKYYQEHKNSFTGYKPKEDKPAPVPKNRKTLAK